MQLSAKEPEEIRYNDKGIAIYRRIETEGAAKVRSHPGKIDLGISECFRTIKGNFIEIFLIILQNLKSVNQIN